MKQPFVRNALLLLGSLLLSTLGVAQQAKAPSPPEGTIPEAWTKNLKWRCVGPATMGGRITALAVYEADPTTYWVGTGGGGLLKTTNRGTTFEHQFDREATTSIGAVAVAPSDKNLVWVGTGEANPRNSVSWGDGVYKSTDGGKSWKHMGLRQSFQIGQIVIHPKNPDVVYVGALGRLWGHNPERGLFKTTDGGKTWQKSLFVDDKTGVIDLIMKPDDPETLIAGLWERQRDGFDTHRGEPPLQDGYDAYDPIKKWGPGGGLYKSTDGGKSWKRLTNGLPSSPLGRIGLDWYRKNPNVVFAILDCQNIGKGTPAQRIIMGVIGTDVGDDKGAKLSEVTANAPAAKAGLKAGDVITAVDGKPLKTYAELTALIPTKKAGDKLKVTFTRDGKSQEATVTLEGRPLQEAQRPTLPQVLGAVAQDEEGGGVRVARILGEGSNLGEGDIIKQAGDKAVTNSQQLLEALVGTRPGGRMQLTVVRDGKDKEVEWRRPAANVSGPGGSSPARPYSFMYGGQQPNVQDQQGPNAHEYGGVYRSDDAGESWKRINSLNPRPMYFSVVRVDPSDDKNLYVLGVSMYRSKDGGKSFTGDASSRVHSDQHALWIDPHDGRHMVVGTDGGFYETHDRCETWDHHNHYAIAQFYHVAVDTRTPYRVMGGLQDNGSWSGPSRSLSGAGPINEDWWSVAGGDGFVMRVDPNNPDLVYYESQDGNIGRRNLRTGEAGSIRPRPVPGLRFRYNWNTPFILSAHNPGIVYSAGNYVFRSVKRGDEMRGISPEIARTGRGTAFALAESPRNQELLWVGTDDGNLWITRDGGVKWVNVADKVGLKKPLWVSSIEASRFVEGRAYVAFDGHRTDDDDPYAFVTEDFGQTWRSLRANLPYGSTRVLREDVKNPNLLLVGTEFAAFASVNRGASWTKLNSNLPSVAVHEFAIHPTAGEVAVATHGRSVWILDLLPLRSMTTESLAGGAFLYEPNVAVRWRREPGRASIYGNGHRRYIGDNPPTGAQICYSLCVKAKESTLRVYDVEGQLVRDLTANTEPGLHVATWDLSRGANRPLGGGPGGGGGGGFFGGPLVPAGRYRVVLTVDGTEYSQVIRVEDDPTLRE